MKLTPRTAGALVAIGGMLFLLFTFGLSRVENFTMRLVDIDFPPMLMDCCGCTGIGLFALPLALLAMTLFKKPDDAQG